MASMFWNTSSWLHAAELPVAAEPAQRAGPVPSQMVRGPAEPGVRCFLSADAEPTATVILGLAMTIRYLTFAFIITMLAPTGLATCQTSDRLLHARTLWEKGDYGKAHDEFVAIGAPAIPFIAETYRTTKLAGAPRFVLEGYLFKIEGDGVEAATLKLLDDPDPRLRGTAIRIVGERRYITAIRDLIRLLDDTAVFLTHMRSHAPSTDVLIRDQAIEALTYITGQTLCEDAPKKQQVAAWRNWWESWDGRIPERTE